MSEDRIVVGHRGEIQAMSHLKEKGYRWLASNVRTRWGEIDLIMEDGPTLVFVEVKTRSENDPYGDPEESITPYKQRHIVKSALSYLHNRGLEDRLIRFDVVVLGSFGIRHHQEAFNVEGSYY